MFCIQRTRAPGYVEVLTGRGVVAEFTRLGTTRVGVGVYNLRQWKTKAGAERWMADRPGFLDVAARYGTVEVVPV